MDRRYEASWMYPVDVYPPEFSKATDPHGVGFLSHLKEHGFAVVEVLSPEECEEAEGIFWDEAGTHFGWDRNRPVSWTAKEKWFTMASRSDCGHFRGWDYSEFQWYCRKKAKWVYDLIYPGAEGDLICAFNSINIFRPFGIDSKWTTARRPWFHIDNRKLISLDRFQISVKEEDFDEAEWAPDSYAHERASGRGEQAKKGEAEELSVGLNEFVPPTVQDTGYLDISSYTQGIDSEANRRTHNSLHTQPVLVCTRGPGRLILWDPRLVHCSTAAIRVRNPVEQPEVAEQTEMPPLPFRPSLLRLLGWISFCPTSWASSKVLREREDLVSRGEGINEATPWILASKRRFESPVCGASVWEDPEVLRFISGKSKSKSA
uniref:Uncharacterized protein n=1 Tax=Chromera velia CCMP2878 TaxID=1169474 RepID=A0A0G4GAP5_9ALVE|eukprot:Cvel_4444.t1-p1 / transcript=Cvel_4444.t1 / gene=Cvel_4444 / organism=Chromera_velia_CCMP2878 / gene_product=hypothetical protein / transcript_product=hypothetical protein / location=Cvel_scaffold193:106380-107861(-) / protein_length=374 / sequence_SO=supercontig / SO=protein_coding / is_pseudo=false